MPDTRLNPRVRVARGACRPAAIVEELARVVDRTGLVIKPEIAVAAGPDAGAGAALHLSLWCARPGWAPGHVGGRANATGAGAAEAGFPGLSARAALFFPAFSREVGYGHAGGRGASGEGDGWHRAKWRRTPLGSAARGSFRLSLLRCVAGEEETARDEEPQLNRVYLPSSLWSSNVDHLPPSESARSLGLNLSFLQEQAARWSLFLGRFFAVRLQYLRHTWLLHQPECLHLFPQIFLKLEPLCARAELGGFCDLGRFAVRAWRRVVHARPCDLRSGLTTRKLVSQFIDERSAIVTLPVSVSGSRPTVAHILRPLLPFPRHHQPDPLQPSRLFPKNLGTAEAGIDDINDNAPSLGEGEGRESAGEEEAE